MEFTFATIPCIHTYMCVYICVYAQHVIFVGSYVGFDHETRKP